MGQSVKTLHQIRTLQQKLKKLLITKLDYSNFQIGKQAIFDDPQEECKQAVSLIITWEILLKQLSSLYSVNVVE